MVNPQPRIGQPVPDVVLSAWERANWTDGASRWEDSAGITAIERPHETGGARCKTTRAKAESRCPNRIGRSCDFMA